MSTQHTPGPWILTTEAPEVEGVNVRFSIDSHTHISICGGQSQEHMKDAIYEDECRANARLIAAAPELLEACQTFAEWLHREEEGFAKAGKDRSTPEGEAAWREWYCENIRICGLAQEQSRAAIAKAIGEQS